MAITNRPQQKPAAEQKDRDRDQRPVAYPKRAQARYANHSNVPAALPCVVRSTSTAAERSGISLASLPEIEKMTVKARSFEEKSPLLATGAISSNLPEKTSSG